MPPAVSVILPCYNVENYLAQCLDSILGQSFGDFELIAVNDGATDRTRDILAEYEPRDPRLKVVDQANGGLGYARNVGLSHARGRYVTFIDSDDYIAPDMLERMVGLAEENRSDVVVGVGLRFRGSRMERMPEGLLSEAHAAFRADEHLTIYKRIVVHGKLFRASFMRKHNLRFQELRSHEDEGFSTIAFAKARVITVTPHPVYFYRRDNGGSITRGRLKTRTLLGRFAQIQTSIALARRADGSRLTHRKRVPFRQLGYKLMLHVSKLADAGSWEEVAEAADLLDRFTRLNERDIRRKCAPHDIAIYEALWARDLPRLKALVGHGERDEEEDAQDEGDAPAVPDAA